MAPLRPLEARFPTLYFDVKHVAAAYDKATGRVALPEEVRFPKPNPPNLFDVITAVLSEHRNGDIILAQDLTRSIGEFLAVNVQVPSADSAVTPEDTANL